MAKKINGVGGCGSVVKGGGSLERQRWTCSKGGWLICGKRNWWWFCG